MATKKKVDTANVSAPTFSKALVEIQGISRLVINRFSAKAMAEMAEKMIEGSSARSKKKRTPRDFDEDFRNALHVSTDGWYGIPATAFRAAAISACRIVGFKMTLAKLSIFIEEDGEDVVDGTGLVKIIGGEPEKLTMPVRNATGVADLRIRPSWKEWGANVRVSFDSSTFTLNDIHNLFQRAGLQVGVCEGRPDSRDSCGLGWGRWTVLSCTEI